MKTDEITHIETLLERFWEGRTTTAEEKELYAFFARPDLPDRWKPYQSLFGFFANDLPPAASSLPPHATWHMQVDTPVARAAAPAGGREAEPNSSSASGIPLFSEKKKLFSPALLRFLAGCAAALLLGLLSLPFIRPERTATDPYEGSFLVRQGVRITERRLIQSELEATLRRVASLEKEMEARMQVIEGEKPAGLLSADPSDTVYTDLLVRYPEGFVRDEARKMLGLPPEGRFWPLP